MADHPVPVLAVAGGVVTGGGGFLEFRAQFGFANYFDSAFSQIRELLIYGHQPID